MHGEVRHKAKDYREPEKPRFPHGCFRGRRGVIRLWDEASDEGRGGKCQHREQDVAAGNDGVLVGEPESKGKEEAQDERKRRPAQQHENADGSECAGDPVHADVADVEAGEHPEQRVPQSRRSFIANGVQHEMPERLIASQKPGLRFVGPGLVPRDAQRDDHGISGQHRALDPSPAALFGADRHARIIAFWEKERDWGIPAGVLPAGPCIQDLRR